MDSVKPRFNYRRNLEYRQRQSRELQRKYQYRGTIGVLLLVVFLIAFVVALGYFTSMGFTFTVDFLSSLARIS